MKILYFLKWLLLPVGLLHMLILWLRHQAFNAGLLGKEVLPRPVISVGNLQLGGSGKTPCVIEICDWLQQAELAGAVLTRGYGRTSKGVRVVGGNIEPLPPPSEIGDEPRMLLQQTRVAAIGISGNRAAAGRAVLQQHNVEAFILDDGLQHRRLHRDLDICLIDVSRWPGHPFLVPFSSLRDLKSRLRQADAVILNKCEQFEPTAKRLETQLRREYGCPVFRAGYRLERIYRLSDRTDLDVEQLSAVPVMAVSAIANPDHFLQTVRNTGAQVLCEKRFGDHHAFQMADITTLLAEKERVGARWIICTTKDAVKLEVLLKDHPGLAENILVLAVKFSVDDAETLRQMVLRHCSRRAGENHKSHVRNK